MTVAVPSKPAEKAVAESRTTRVKNILFSSMFVWMVVLIIAVDQVSRLVYSHVDTGYSEKLTNFFESDRHPDVLLFGSSIALSSSFESDSAIGVLSKKDQKNHYYGAVDLQNAIQSATGMNLNIENLACFGSMANHAWLEAEKLVEFEKIPKAIIYETASRDLFDASIPRSFESEYYRTLAFLHPKHSGASPLQAVGDLVVNSHVVTLFRNLVSDPQTMKTPDRLRFEFDSALGALICVYRHRLELLAELSNLSSNLFSRASSFQGAVSKIEMENKRKNPFAKVSAQSGGTFAVDSAPQLGRFEDEKVYFLKLLQVCKENRIKLIIVNMPVTEQYENLVPTELKSRWPKEVQEATEKAGFAFIDLNDQKVFPASDFIDFAHLNQRGALKVNDLIAREIAKRDLFKGL